MKRSALGSKGWIGVDFDGTLAHYTEWKGIDHCGAPIALMVSRVKRWLLEGYEVRIFTARVSEANHEEARRHIEEWCLAHLGAKLPVTNAKDLHMIELWDDRAVQVHLNKGTVAGFSTRGLDG
jgi:hypothetical protein